MVKVTKVLIMLKNMIYESTSPMEAVRFAKYYKNKELEVTVVLWGPMGALLGKKNKEGRMRYEEEVEECISMGEALKAYTINGAFAAFEENVKGSIEIGKLADFVILNKNPLEINNNEIKYIQVLETIIRGKTVYRDI